MKSGYHYTIQKHGVKMKVVWFQGFPNGIVNLQKASYRVCLASIQMTPILMVIIALSIIGHNEFHSYVHEPYSLYSREMEPLPFSCADILPTDARLGNLYSGNYRPLPIHCSDNVAIPNRVSKLYLGPDKTYHSWFCSSPNSRSYSIMSR